jgi:N-methylhydantoinase A/oxoprolinase/acetone carboxylase beta subunit
MEATTWRVTAVGRKVAVELPKFERGTGKPSPSERRPVYFPECEGFADTPIYDRYQLFAGAELEGPAVVEERESTTVLPPGTRAEVDERGTLTVTLR